MFDKWLNLPAHYYLRITAFTILMVGVAVSNVLMSIGAIWIISNWLIEADFKDYRNRFKKSPIAWMFLAFFIFSIVSLLWSDDVAYGVRDLRIKLPFLVIPLIMALSKPIKDEVFYYLLYVFLGIICLTTIWNYIWYNYFFEDANDIRKMSRFLSHVRFSILVDLAIFSGFYLILKKKLNLFLVVGIILWLLFYTYKAQILSGYLLLVVLGAMTVIYLIKLISVNWVRQLSMISFFILIAASIAIAKNIMNSEFKFIQQDFSNLEEYTANGNRYYHDTLSRDYENGNSIWVYVNQDELMKEWNKHSEIDYKGLDNKGQPMFGTLLRYMTSKNLRKDSLGFSMLSKEEIKDIENGHTSILMNSSGIREKMNAFMIDYQYYKQGGDPNGHSITQRIEHLRVALGIIKDDWLLGVGIGDVDMVFKEKYEAVNSKLLPENQHRSHNQFLTIWISHGVIGVFLLLTIILFPALVDKKPDYFLMIVTVSLIVSFIFQDMIETQAGATIFGLFYALAVFRKSDYRTEPEI